MEEAVEAGASFLLSRGEGTVLLSPGCSGAPFFDDLFVRGDVYKACVKAYLEKARRVAK